MRPSVEIVIVSYERDREQCVNLVTSIRTHGFLHTDIPIKVVVNDSVDSFQGFAADLQVFPYLKVIHRAALGINSVRGWLSQQWLKLAVARLIEAEWYVILDSDQGLWLNDPPVEFNDWFYNNKAYYKPVKLSQLCPEFQRYWTNAADFWQIDLNSFGELLLSETPPMVFHTQTVLDMLQYVNKKMFIVDANIHEAGLYWSFVMKSNLRERLYLPFNTISKKNLLREGRPCPPC
jgi:hypothetical protein